MGIPSDGSWFTAFNGEMYILGHQVSIEVLKPPSDQLKNITEYTKCFSVNITFA